MKNYFKNENMNLAKATRVMARDSKKLMQKCIGMLFEQYGLDLDDLEEDQIKLVKEYMSFCNKAFDLMELNADALEAQEERMDRIESSLDAILKEVKKK